MKTRQKNRKILLTAAFLLTPVSLYYFSPVLSLQGTAGGIITGSVVVFFCLFLSSLFLGRAFCGWACPMGGMQELLFGVRILPVQRKKINRIKFFIWGPWFLVPINLILRVGGIRSVQPFFMTRAGVSVTALFTIPALILGT